MKQKIKEYFKENDLPKPISIKEAGKWHLGNVYAVTCGHFRIKKYAVYTIDNRIHSVRKRGT